MAEIQRLGTKFFLGADLPEKVTKEKVNEIIDRVNDTTDGTNSTVAGSLTVGTSVNIPDGTVRSLALRLGADGNNGIYGVSDTSLGIAVEGVLVGGANGLGLFTDIIAEQTVAAGVTIDQALIKDGSFSINSNYVRLKPIAVKQALVGAGAVTLTQWYTTLDTNAGAAAITLANAVTIGQTKKIQMIVDNGDATLTPTSLLGGTTITFADPGDFAILTWNGTAWVAEELGNDADGVTAPVLA